MYRVMIVDDEEPVLDSFSFIFKKYVSDFTLCGKARSGTEAIKEIKEKTPDLVFMDIQMPGVDGIEVIRQIRPLFPDIVFILATAYERFDIAQKAIHLGVFSYLVKPVSRNKILEELDKVKDFLDQQQKVNENLIEEEELLEKNKSEMLRSFLSNLIWKNPDDKKWDDFVKLFSINSDRAAIYLIGGVNNLAADIRKDLFTDITRKIQYKYNCLSIELGDKLLLFFPEEMNLNKLEEHMRDILTNKTVYHLVMGVGSSYHYSELTKSFTEAFSPFSEMGEGDIKRNKEQRRIISIHRAIFTSERTRGEDLFKEYWIEKFKKDHFDVARGKMVALFTLLLQDIDDHILIRSSLNIDPAKEIMSLDSIESWQRWAADAMKEIFNLLERQKSHSYPKPLKKALAFIAENYNHQLQLTSVAEECLVSGSYLSRLFSEHLDTKFIDYVNHYRINQAVILLRDKNISIKETSYLVGYQDPNYFSRIFRKVLGFSPSDFEKRGNA